MTRRRKLTLAAGVALALIAAVLLWPRAKGPTPEGKTMEEWFHSYYEALAPGRAVTDSDLQLDYAGKAFVALGTNAVPYLVEKMMQDTAYSKVETWRIKLHAVVPSALKPLVPLPRDKSLEGGFAVNLLSGRVRPPAEMLLPLIRPALEGTNVIQQTRALQSLAGLSGDRQLALPYNFKGLESSDQYVQWLALNNMPTFKWEGWVGLDATLAVSNLTIMASSTDQHTAESALRVLRNLGTNASPAVPALQEMLAKETDAYRRNRITNALEKIQSPVAPERKPD